MIAAGIFLMGTTEFMIVGLRPEAAADLGVDVARAGLLVTAFVVGMIVGPPVMALATLRLPSRATLVGALAVMSGGLSLAGVPLGTFAGQLTGWRGPFWMLAGLSLLAIGAVLRSTRPRQPPGRGSRGIGPRRAVHAASGSWGLVGPAALGAILTGSALAPIALLAATTTRRTNNDTPNRRCED